MKERVHFLQGADALCRAPYSLLWLTTVKAEVSCLRCRAEMARVREREQQEKT